MFKKRQILWSTLSVAAFVLLTFVFVVARMKSAAPLQPPSSSTRAEQPVSKERVEMVQITVQPTGFEPAEVEHSNKPFLLAFDNQSGIESLALELYQADSEGRGQAKLREKRMSLEALSKREIIHLPPGRYVLKEASHPEWACHITIGEH